MPNIVEIIVKGTQQGTGLKEAAKDTKDAAREIGNATEEIEEHLAGVSSTLTDTGKALALGAGVAIGGALTMGFQKSLEFESANAKLQAQLGGSAEFSAEMGKVAGDLYADAYGSSMGQVSDALAAVVQSGALMADASNEQIESITGQAISLADAFGIDVAESMRAVGNMVKTGMAPDAQAGLDLITVAFQKLGPQAHDIIDTFTEYSVQFQKIGIDGTDALGLVQQAVDAGAESTDKAADAVKEFSIRSVDGSKAAAESFRALGFNAEEMTATFAAGGPRAREAFNQVTDALAEAQGRADYATIAFGLFGTQSEDLGAALGAMNLDTAAQGLGEVAGAAQKVDEALGDTAQNKITAMQRSMEEMLASFVNAPGVIGGAGTVVAAFGATALEMGSQLALVALALPTGFATAAASAATNFGKMIVSVGAYVVASVAGAATSAAAWVTANIAMIAATGGIILVIGAVVAAVYLLIQNWDTVKAAAVLVWEVIKHTWGAIGSFVTETVGSVIGFVKDNWQLLISIILGPLGIIIVLIVEHWDKIKYYFMLGVNTVLGIVKLLEQLPEMVLVFIARMVAVAINKVNELLQFFRGFGKAIFSAVGDVANTMAGIGTAIISGIWNGISAGWNWLLGKIRSLASALLDAAMSAIGIGSPSKDFDEKFGAMVPAGAARGVERNSDVAQNAVRAMSRDILASIPTDLGDKVRALLGGIGTPSVSPSMPSLGRRSGGTANGSGAGQPVQVSMTLNTSGSRIDELLAEILRKYVTFQGGNVQEVLGK